MVTVHNNDFGNGHQQMVGVQCPLGDVATGGGNGDDYYAQGSFAVDANGKPAGETGNPATGWETFDSAGGASVFAVCAKAFATPTPTPYNSTAYATPSAIASRYGTPSDGPDDAPRD